MDRISRGGQYAGLALGCSLLSMGCDPVLDVDGAFFPAWMFCLVVGTTLTFLVYPLFVRLGIEGYVGPPVLIYPCLALFLTLAVWLVFFRT
ncbi:MAG: hypothetical protein CL917_08830 [Deltaproteobacteria bacterium]|nr:hypothetical protein [Deltaproteobacteria bacterium]